MKRIIAILLAVMMLSALCAVCSTANDICEPYGEVPKVPQGTIRLDGEMEDVYAQGLRIDIARYGGGADQYAIGDSEAYFLYDDDNLYIYVIAQDSEYGIDFDSYFHVCPICQRQQRVQADCEHVTEETQDKHNIWDDDCVEFFIDLENDGEGAPRQMRTSRHGEMTYNWSTKDTGFNAKGKDYGSYWCAEYAVPLEMSARGTELGVDIMIHNQASLEPYAEYWIFASNSSDTGNTWESMYYDYIILGADLDPEKPTQPTPTKPTDDKTKPTGPKPTQVVTSIGTDASGNTVIITSYVPVDDPDEKGPAQTADPIVMIVLAAVMSLGAAVVVKKTCFHK